MPSGVRSTMVRMADSSPAVPLPMSRPRGNRRPSRVRLLGVLQGPVGSTVIAVGLSLLITGVMSWLFHRELRPDFLTTGFVAGALVNLIVLRVVKSYRARLRAANQRLETRVAERTMELEEANEALRAEMARREALQRKLMVVDRLASAGQLAAGVSHEIRNPVASILANVAYVRDLVADEEPAAEALGDVEEAARRVHVLCNDLTTLSRPAEDLVEPVVLADVVGSARRLAAHELRDAAVTIEVPQLVVRGTASRLCQVFLNLLINAAKASSPSRDGHRVDVVGRQDGDVVIVEVRDCGSGIAPEHLARVWEPHFTTRASTGGTGLGMPMVKAIVEGMEGQVGLESRVGEGTTVRLRLPAWSDSDR